MKGKASLFVLLVTVVLAVVVVIEETRIGELKRQVAELEKSKEVLAMKSREVDAVMTTNGDVVSSKSERESKEPPGGKPATAAEEFGKTMRKMADNPAAQAMFAQGHKATVMSIYGSLIDEFDLSEEEKDYFVTLLAGEFAGQQQMGMKLMGAQTDEEREAIFAEMKEAGEEREAAVKDFLNDEEDHEKFENYHNRIAEHQQMPGIKAAMTAAGVDLRPEQETQLIDAMYEVRVESYNGKDKAEFEQEAFSKLGDDDTLANFERDWEKHQTNLMGKLEGVLDDDQREPFVQTQAQMKEFHAMGIKMMQGMIKGDQN